MIPDHLPLLKSGCHDNPRDGACVMEYISLIKGEPWSDQPLCTSEYIADIARNLNDYPVSDDLRSEVILPLIGKIMACGNQADGLEFLDSWAKSQCYDGYDSYALWLSEFRTVVAVGPAFAHVSTSVGVRFVPQAMIDHGFRVRAVSFERMLDAYISFFNLTEEQVEEAEFAAATAKVFASVL